MYFIFIKKNPASITQCRIFNYMRVNIQNIYSTLMILGRENRLFKFETKFSAAKFEEKKLTSSFNIKHSSFAQLNFVSLFQFSNFVFRFSNFDVSISNFSLIYLGINIRILRIGFNKLSARWHFIAH